MLLLPLLLLVTPVQTSTAVMAVRAQVTQTCVVTAEKVTCRGARDRPEQRRVIRGGLVTVVEF
ncbi:hypothetical protein [Brevundimonas sp. Root1423]|uniref:hypothetical protein n=1 Tax=Brevundimonas sp. Root1423 TaxID=1736462 RepID=UPI0006FECC0B|nr:hypothetical protein [Brevundimonas sp. Root1423]KQY84736.1 hypothetical protein ASD25_06825 [Brevundimonas sp. Root1423]